MKTFKLDERMPEESELVDGETREAAAMKLARTYAYCPSYPRARQVIPIYDPELPMGVDSMRTRMLRWAEQKVGPRGGMTTLNPVDTWLASKDLIEVAGVRMNPVRPRPVFDEDGRRWINTWQPPLHDALPEGQDVFLEFMQHLTPDRREREWYLDCEASKLRNPGTPGPGVLMVARNQGVGRGTYFAMLRQLHGLRYTCEIDPGTLTGDGSQSQYTNWLDGSVMVFVAELIAPGETVLWRRQRLYDKVKLLVDPATRRAQILQKGMNNYEAEVFAGFRMATNHPNALPMERDDRRVSVLTNGDVKLADNTALAARLNRYRVGSGFTPGFIAGIADLLSRRDISKFDPYDTVPMFAGKERMINATMSNVTETAAAVLDELPGDFITRDAFIKRVRRKVSDHGDEGPNKHLIEEARNVIDHSAVWVFLGRVRCSENDAKADVWGRGEGARKRWLDTPLAAREQLLAANDNPTTARSEALRKLDLRRMKVVKGGRDEEPKK